MKKLLYTAVFLIQAMNLFCQEPELNSKKGIRLKKGTSDLIIYADHNMSPKFEDWRKLNYRVYFRTLTVPAQTVKGRNYILITIPGEVAELTQDVINKFSKGPYPLAGFSVSKFDFDRNFWVDSILLAQSELETEYFQYENSPFIGTLTAPFKLRMAVGSSSEAFIDGAFNVSQYLGWKFRLSNKKPYFISPFVFGGITTISYSSAINSGITDPERKESGAGMTYGGGVAFRFGTISPGIIFGFDHGFGDLGKTFEYNDKIWLGFSLNFEFFKPKEPDSDSEEAKPNKLR